MNRDRLTYRKFLREMAWMIAAVGVVLVMFDWLLWGLLFPAGPWWLRIAGDVVGVALVWIAAKIVAHAKALGRLPRAGDSGGRP